MPSINYATKASPKVSEAFYKESVTEGLFSQEYDWTGVATVRVYGVDDLELQNYNATKVDGSRFGTLTELGDTVQELTVNDDKSFNGAIDKRNNTSTLMIKAAGRVLNRQTRNVIIPYVDKYRLAKLAIGNGITGFGGAGGGTIVYNETLAKNTAIEKILTRGATMSNKLVPKKGRVLYIGETNAIAIKLADQVVGVDKLAERSIVNGVCGTIDGMQVRIVPDSYMPTNVVYMIVTKGVAVAPKKIETYRIIQDHPDIDGHVVQGRFLHDCFVLQKKADGILVAYSTSGASGASGEE